MKPQTTRTFSFLTLLVTFVFLSSCTYSEGKVTRGDGNVVTSTIPLSDFDEIDLQGGFNVVLKQGSDLEVVIETDENLMELLDVEVRGKTLYVSTTREAVLKPTKMILTITYPALRGITVGGACKIESEEVIQSDDLRFDISGAAEIDLAIVAEVLRTELAGAGSINFEGKVREHYIDLAGASSLEAKELITEVTEIDLSGAGSASVHATTSLRASLSGVGSIKYYGNPGETQIDKSGLGSIRSAE
ncbi:MAG: head GIN domain-containing protein [Bacteroides sp.]|jgi:hypothetical protein|nr:head GIN domain-containing protein [Bacteroides sp.]